MKKRGALLNFTYYSLFPIKQNVMSRIKINEQYVVEKFNYILSSADAIWCTIEGVMYRLDRVPCNEFHQVDMIVQWMN